MYKLCRTDLSARRQQRLEQGLLEAMKSRQYEDISVSDLCRQLEIPRKCFYRYFDSKDGALHALIDHTLMEYVEWGSGLNPENMSEKLEQFFRFWKENRVLLDALEDSGLTKVLVKRAIGIACRDSMFPQMRNPHTENTEPAYLVSFWVSGFIALVMSWRSGGFTESPAQMARIAAGIIGESSSLSDVPRIK